MSPLSLLIISLFQALFLVPRRISCDDSVMSTMCMDLLDDSSPGVGNFPRDIRRLYKTLPLRKDVCDEFLSDGCQEREYPAISVYFLSQRTATDRIYQFNWLLVRISHRKPLRSFYIAGETDEKGDNTNPIFDRNTDSGHMNQAKGEFFIFDHKGTQTCPKTILGKYMIIPCGGIGRSEYVVSNAVFYVDPKLGNWSDTLLPQPKTPDLVIPKGLGSQDFYFFYRHTDLYCNVRNFYFRMWALVESNTDSTKLELRQARTSFIRMRGYHGAPSAIFDHNKNEDFECTRLSKHEGEETTKDNPPWIFTVPTGLIPLKKKESCTGQRGMGQRFGNSVEDKSKVIVEGPGGKTSHPVLKSGRCYWKNEILHPSTTTARSPTELIQLHYCKMSYGSESKHFNDVYDAQTYDDYVENFLASNRWKCECSTKYSGVIAEPGFVDDLGPIPRGVSIVPPKLMVLTPKPRVKDAEPKTTTTTTKRPKTTTTTTTTTERATTTTASNTKKTTKKTTTTSPNLQSTSPPKVRKLDPKKGIRADVETGKVLWRMRTGHAVTWTIVVMFITPLSHLLARWYKETFMEVRVLYFRVWAFIHTQSIPSTWIFIYASLVSILMSRQILGRSLLTSSLLHRFFGWWLIVLYFIMSIFGGIRCLEDKQRKLSIAAHALAGLVFQFGCIFVLLLSLAIPGSPLATDDATFEYGSDGNAAPIAIVLVWMFVDIGFNVMLGLNEWRASPEVQELIAKDRIKLPVLIPILPEDSLKDTPGSQCRRILLAVYVLIALFFTLALIYVIEDNSPIGRGFGPMYCTHEDWNTTLVHLKEDCHWSKTNLSAVLKEGEEMEKEIQMWNH